VAAPVVLRSCSASCSLPLSAVGGACARGTCVVKCATTSAINVRSHGNRLRAELRSPAYCPCHRVAWTRSYGSVLVSAIEQYIGTALLLQATIVDSCADDILSRIYLGSRTTEQTSVEAEFGIANSTRSQGALVTGTRKIRDKLHRNYHGPLIIHRVLIHSHLHNYRGASCCTLVLNRPPIPDPRHPVRCATAILQPSMPPGRRLASTGSPGSHHLRSRPKAPIA
jgi:hypothetical protein